MTTVHRDTIISIIKALLANLNLTANDQSIVYHHWYDLTLGKRISEEGTGTTKSCPGTDFFGGNTINSFNSNFLPLL